VWYGLAGLLVGLVTAFLRSLAAGESDNALLPISTGCTVAVLGLIAHRVLSGRVGGRFVALTPGGIIVGTRGTAQLIGWDDVRRTSRRDAVPRIDLHSTSIGVALEDIFASEKEWVDFANAVKDWRARARTAAE